MNERLEENERRMKVNERRKGKKVKKNDDIAERK